MKRLCGSLTLAAAVLIAVAPATEAAGIRVREDATGGGGSILNDGSADVRSSDGSTLGDTSLMRELGLTDVNLAADLLALRITGQVTDEFVFNPLDPATSADIFALRIFGTAEQPCVDCAKLSDVRVGSSLGNNPLDPANVLFAINVIGGDFTPAGVPWTAPGGLTSPVSVALGTPLTFQLNQLQVNFIVNQMQLLGLGVDDVRIGLGARSVGLTDAAIEDAVQSEFSIADVPEPTSLLLFGSAAAAFATRRRLSARPR